MSIVVGTFGSAVWQQMAAETADKALSHGVPVLRSHGESLAEARNAGAEAAESEWIIFLDADGDELAPGYIPATAEAEGDLRAPRLVQVRGRIEVELPVASRDVEQLNPCCIGTAYRREMFLDLGGFPQQFDAWEDWALALLAHRAGATITHTDAIYRQKVRRKSRNNGVGDPQRLHEEIRAWA